jgi:hypothetical protein
MKTPLRFMIVFAFGLAVAAGASAADHQHGSHGQATTDPAPAPAGDHAEWLAAAKAAYPLDTCVVSGEKLADGEMGPPIDYVHKVEGQLDRLVRFCCKDCARDFRKDPAKYLALIDAAAAKKSAEQKGHSSHH